MMSDNESSKTYLHAGEEDGLFYFESDHLALKGNRDYSEMLKTLVLLEMQYSKAIKDYEKIMEMQADALSRPHTFFKKILSGMDLDIPELQVIVELPNIDWSKYPVELPTEVQQFINKESIDQKVNTEPVHEPEQEKKPTTNKKTWSTEEQRRLEELLVTYPPEPVELHRYKKIAAALGNRTVQQVSSRVQKYFLKLYKAGLPIPGRIPKNAEKAKKSKLHAHQRFNHLLFKPTTFFPQLDIPVVMNEKEVVPGPSTDASTFTTTGFQNYLLPTSSEHVMSSYVVEETKSNIDIQIEILKRVKLEKQNPSSYPIQHLGYKCSYCAEEPIYGTRWHCEICTPESVDFCSDCVVGQMHSVNPHPLSHNLKPYSEETNSESKSSNESLTKDSNDFIKNEIGYSSTSSSSNSDNGGDDMNTDQDQSMTNDMDNFTNYRPENSMDIEQKIDYPLNFEPNSEHSLVTDSRIDTATDKKDWFHDSPYSNEFSNAKDNQNSKDNLFEDESNLFTDAQNLSYSYLHSKIMLEEN